MNWKPIIEKLCEAYGDQKTVAALAGIEQSSVTRLKTGETQRINYESGVRLIELHRQALRKLARAKQAAR